MDFNKIFQSKIFKGMLWGLGILVLVLVIFKAGLVVGSKKANFSCRWGENYYRNFGGPPRGGFMGGIKDRAFPNAHGLIGQILKVDGLTINMKAQDGTEKIVLVTETTDIKKMNAKVKIIDLTTADTITVIGEPNEAGQIVAKFIRVVPPPPPEVSFNKFNKPWPRRGR